MVLQMEEKMKKVSLIGVVVGVSFLAGAIFFALTFGYFQQSPPKPVAEQNKTGIELPANSSRTLTMPSAQAQETSMKGHVPSFAPLVKRVRGAVVKVKSEVIRESRGSMRSFEDFFRRRGRSRRRQPVIGTGSGFFISNDGYILTNNHVVKDAVKVTIIDINEKEYTAKKIGLDPKTDLALLKIKGNNFPYIELGDSDALEVGEWVLAIGNPLDQDLSVTSGIVSAKGRNLQGLDVDFQNFIQTDAAINRGNSGGPLINMDGKAVGINSVILSPGGGNIGIGFAIPSNMAKKVIKDLKKEGRVIRSVIGVGIKQLTAQDAKDLGFPHKGVMIVSVEKNGPADKAGIERFDLIIGVNGKKVTNEMVLRNKISSTPPGNKVKIKVFREDKEMTFTVKVKEAPDSVMFRSEEKGGEIIDLGMVIQNNSRSLAEQYELSTSDGVVIMEIQRGGVAYQHRLKVGDIITGINRTKITNTKQFEEIIAKKTGSSVFLSITRGPNEFFIKFSVP